MFRLRSLLLQSLTLLAAPAFAATLNVGPGQPYTTIQSAINAANNGDTVLVYPGTYYENIDFKGKAITVTSTSGPSGGAANTIIDGMATPGLATVSFHTGELRSSIISNFTIQNGGNTTFASTVYGGGVFVELAAPTILNNVIANNTDSGVFIEAGDALVQGNTISNTIPSQTTSYSPFPGNGIVLFGATTVGGYANSTVIGNTIENNTKGSDFGGAIWIWGANGAVIQNNVIRNNVSSQGAVQMYNTENIIFSQNLVYNNSVSGDVAAGSGAGGLYFLVPNGGPLYGIIAGNTIVNNTTSRSIGGGSQVYIDGWISKYSFVNNILYGTGSFPALICGGVYAKNSAPMLVENNDVFNPSGPAYDSSCANGAGSAGNISVDPLFNNPANNDFHLKSGSPAIDVGNNQALTMLTPYGVNSSTDLDGNQRVQNVTGTPCAIIDIGAYEYPGAPDTCSYTETLKSSLNPSTVGQTVTFTAQLTSPLGIPTGDVQFSDGSTVLGAQLISSTGLSSYTTSSLAVGSHTITAAYQPTGVFSPTTASLIQQVNGYTTTTTLTSSLNPSLATQSVTFTAAVASSSGTPTGSVQFFDGSTLLATQTLTSAIATYSTSALAAGTHNMQAVYVPTGSFAASTGSLTQVVTGIATTTNLSCNPNPLYITQSPVLFATVTSTNGIPTGSVTFTDNGVAILPTPPFTAGATATENNYQFTSPGTHTIVAAYVPSGNFAASSASCSVVVNLDPTTTALTSSLDPSVFSQPVTFTATVTFGPPVVNFAGYGTVTFSDGAAILQTVTINSTSVSGVGTATYTTGTLAQGTHNITATLNPNSAPFLEYASSSASLTQVVNNVPTTISLSASPNPAPQGQTVTITAKVVSSTGAAPPGTVSFLDAGAVIGVTPVNNSGVATLPTSTLALGNHLLVAVYVPDPTSSFLASSSNDFTETIEANAFTIALSPSTLTLTAGMSGSTTVQLASGGLFSGPLTLSFGTLPQYATGTLSTSAVTLTAGGNASSTFSLQTSMIGANSIPPRPGSRAETITLYALLLALPLAFRRRRLRNLFVLCAAAFLLQTLTACTTIRTPLHLVPAGTYQIPFTATDAGSNSRTQSLTLIIQ